MPPPKDRRTRAALINEINGLKALLFDERQGLQQKLDDLKAEMTFDLKAARDGCAYANTRSAELEARVVALEGELVATRPAAEALAATEDRLKVLQHAYDTLLAERDQVTEERERWRTNFLDEQRQKNEARELLIRQAHLAGEVAKLATPVSLKTARS